MGPSCAVVRVSVGISGEKECAMQSKEAAAAVAVTHKMWESTESSSTTTTALIRGHLQ